MARMIPPHWHEGTPHSEQQVFSLLKSDPLTEDWVVLHSLGLKQSGTLPYGEIDFVVLIPGAGVICVEVKGGRVACTSGVWTTTDGADVTHILKRSPYAQAQQGMHEVRNSLEQGLARAPEFYKVPFGYAVIFPDIDAPPVEIGIQPWETVDRRGMNSGLAGLLFKAAKHQRTRLHIASTPLEPQPPLLRRLRELLRPDFERVVARGTIIGDSERRLLRLTEEQYDLLDRLADNPRCLFEGAAGTGKTLLALEFAKRCAIAGDRVLLVCFNKLLGDWFASEVRATISPGGLTAGRFYKCLRDVIMRSAIADEFRATEQRTNNALFDSDYLLYGQLALEPAEEKYDVIVMDEAQDLLRPSILDLLDTWLKGTLRDGRWAFFGDFHRQAIYGRSNNPQPHECMRERGASYVRAKFTQNCRNTRRIGEETAFLSGFDSPPYRMGQVDGVPVDYTEYADTDSQSEALDGILSRLCAEQDIRPNDVVILSRYRFEQSVAAILKDSGTFWIRPVDQPPIGSKVPTFRFATAQAFKGMESKVIVLCDVDRIQAEEDRALLYVAMSRARSLLIVLLHVRTKNAVREAFRKKLSEQWRNA